MAIVAALRGAGVRIVGDLEALAAPQASRLPEGARQASVPAPARVAAEMAMGTALATGLARRVAGDAYAAADGGPELERVSAWQLVSVVTNRSRAAVRTRAGGLVRVARSVRARPVGSASASRTASGPGAAATPVGATPVGATVSPVEVSASPAAAPGGPVLPGPLPDGTRILHIGPPKTGTTSLQGAFWTAREDALAQGVRYAGRSRHSAHAVWAVTGRRSFDEGRAVPPIRHWTALLDEIRGAAEPRVLLSSEGFSYAAGPAIERVVGDLDPARLHVVVTLRPVGRLLASEWQEHAQSGMALPYDAWLRRLFNEPDRPATAWFWHRQRHDQLIERWAAQVGRDRVTAIVADERDHDALLRAFEALCGLRTGTIAHDRSAGNRSLTLEEITAIRALRERWTAEGLSTASFHRVVRMRVAAEMKKRVPGPDEPRIETPQWALDRAAGIASEIVAGIAASGVRVIGDLERLREMPRGFDGEAMPEVRVPPAISAAMAMGVLAASGVTRRSGGTWIEPVETARISTRRVARVVASRAVAGLARRGPATPPGDPGAA